MSKIKKDERFEAKDKQEYRILNWSTYNQALENRGNITFIIDDQVIQSWYSDSPTQRGAQEVYSDVCVETIMMIKTVFRLPYRQARGFTVGLLKLMNLFELQVPSFTQVNRRFHRLDIAPFDIPKSGSITVAIDSTGVKVYGEGEWKCRKHGWSKRRTWRKLHLGIDPDTGFIHCHTTTTNSESDESQIQDLLDQVDTEVDEVYLDGAYDAQTCYDGLLERDIWPVIPPQRGAVKWYWEEPGDADDYPRNKFIERIDEIGRAEWKKEVGYHRRSLSETAMFRYKTIFGPIHYSRLLETQIQENKMKIKALNRMTALGMPISQAKVA
ncbi:MAG: IS5 family transposase [Bacteroidota bacterium]